MVRVQASHLHELALADGAARDHGVDAGHHVLLQHQPRAQVDAEHLRRPGLDGRQLRHVRACESGTLPWSVEPHSVVRLSKTPCVHVMQTSQHHLMYR